MAFDNQVKAHVLSTAISGCAVAGYAKAGTDLIEDWPPGGPCTDVQPVTMKCARAGIAIAGYAHAGWNICACSETRWITQEQTNISMPLNQCDDEAQII